ncbi:hypothetical protein PVAND_002759 [Polypedilum vanderplanki]|uniref:Short-chain dehydrogenase/reductase 3 n=1 Tax=Polypedilum vanderplanki TaxID=319348 RepID=A0A9J6BTL2_POLVA|nr:hypothetical protein PVAND_002759 [Polypedilum vanderplanki]
MLIFSTKIIFIAIKETILNLIIPKKPKDIRGQLALITGGANGLGRATAIKLAMEGCDIVIIDINENEAIKTAQEIRDVFDVKVKAYKVDVSNFEAIQTLKDDIDVDFPGQSVDILINNAGILSKISLCEGQYQQIQKVIDVNLTAHFWTTRTFLSQMIEKKRGHIVGISSMSAKVTLPCAISYCSTKYGVDGFYSALYDELCVDEHDEYIKTTCIFPSFINTREELTKILDQMKGVGPRMSASYVASQIVNAIKNNKKSLILPFHARFLYLARRRLKKSP